MVQNRQWDKLHNYVSTECPCTGVAAKGDDTVVTVGEDGRICVLSTEQTAPVRVIGTVRTDDLEIKSKCMLSLKFIVVLFYQNIAYLFTTRSLLHL